MDKGFITGLALPSILFTKYVNQLVFNIEQKTIRDVRWTAGSDCVF